MKEVFELLIVHEEPGVLSSSGAAILEQAFHLTYIRKHRELQSFSRAVERA